MYKTFDDPLHLTRNPDFKSRVDDYSFKILSVIVIETCLHSQTVAHYLPSRSVFLQLSLLQVRAPPRDLTQKG